MVIARLAVPCVLVAVVGCAPVDGPVVVEALVPVAGAAGGVGFGDVELASVTDLQRGRGALFDVRGGVRVNNSDFLTVDDDDSFDAMVERIRGDGGVDVDAHMSFDGTRYVADDFETLFYFSMFANFESAFAAATAFGDDSDATKRPAVVGMFATIQAAPFLPITLLNSDNAAYAAPVDGWLALRSAVQDGVPFAMHRGVIAHEFGHRLFFMNVFGAIDGGFETWRAATVNQEPTVTDLRALMLLKGVDEGLADVFAIASLADKDAINAAFADAGSFFAAEAVRRDVEGDFGAAVTYEGLRDLSLDATQLQDCGLTEVDYGGQFNFYCVGTLLAATLWDGAGRDASAFADVVEPAVVRALPAVGDALVNGAVFDVDVFLNAFVAELDPGDTRARMCEAIGARFATFFAEGRMTACP